jgi:hypothetical protein
VYKLLKSHNMGVGNCPNGWFFAVRKLGHLRRVK